MACVEFNLLLVPNPGTFKKGEKIMRKPDRVSTSTTSMTSAAASRIQSATARKNDGRVPSNSFASRAQSAAARKVGPKAP